MSESHKRRHRNAWEKVLDEEIDDVGSTNITIGDAPDLDEDHVPQVITPSGGGLDSVADVDDRGNVYAVEEAPLTPGDDGDDVKKLTPIKFRIDGNGDQQRLVASLAPRDMVASGHGFLIDDRRSRPWKTMRRTHCAYCGGPMPAPDLSKYPCEFDPDATPEELARVGNHNGVEDRGPKLLRQMMGASGGCRHGAGCRCGVRGCQCSGCILRSQVANGMERNCGQPRKYCQKDCTRRAGNERRAWERATAKAIRLGLALPPEPEDRGLKFVMHRGPRSSAEGSCLRA